MQKRGQLTLFIIIGIVLAVVILGLVFLFVGQNTNSASDDYFNAAENKVKVDAMREYLEDCIDSTTEEALVIVAFQGGYYNPPSRTFDYSPVFFPYYYYEGEVVMPTIEKIEGELGEYVSDNIVTCADNWDFGSLDVNYERPQTEVRVTRDNAFFQVNMPLEIESDGYTTTLDMSEYTKNYNSSLFEIHEIATYITESHADDPEYYCISCVSEMANERGVFVYLYPNIANEFITGIMIYENRTGLGNPYTYVFFNKYTGEEKTPKLQA